MRPCDYIKKKARCWATYVEAGLDAGPVDEVENKEVCVVIYVEEALTLHPLKKLSPPSGDVLPDVLPETLDGLVLHGPAVDVVVCTANRHRLMLRSCNMSEDLLSGDVAPALRPPCSHHVPPNQDILTPLVGPQA